MDFKIGDRVHTEASHVGTILFFNRDGDLAYLELDPGRLGVHTVTYRLEQLSELGK